MLAAAPFAMLAAHALPSIITAAPVDPISAAFAELAAASFDARECSDDAEFGSSLLAFVRETVALYKRLCAEHGDEAGQFIWSAAMDRHHRWLRERYGLRDA